MATQRPSGETLPTGGYPTRCEMLASARAALRTAFRDGPRWRPATAVDAAPLPPLYPPR